MIGPHGRTLSGGRGAGAPGNIFPLSGSVGGRTGLFGGVPPGRVGSDGGKAGGTGMGVDVGCGLGVGSGRGVADGTGTGVDVGCGRGVGVGTGVPVG